MSIRVEYSDEIDQPFVAIRLGEHVKLFKNTKMTAWMPYWLQEHLVNEALRTVEKPSGGSTQQVATVIELDRLREVRALRACSRAEVVHST